MIPLPIQYAELEVVYSQTIAQGMQSIAICAAERGEGVTTLAYALARRAAASGHKTLYVDFDMANPAIADWLALERSFWEPGTPSAMADIQRFKGSDLAFLTAPDCEELSFRFRDPDILGRQFKEWLEHFDVVVCDTSPVNAMNRNNVPPDIVAAACEGCLLVVLANRTLEAQVRVASDRLHEIGANFSGIVVNDRFNPSLAEDISDKMERVRPKMPRFAGVVDNMVGRMPFLRRLP